MKSFRVPIWKGAIIVLIGIASFIVGHPTIAGPITNGPGVAPFSRLSVYEGVVAVQSSAGGLGVLEIGYRGEDLAGTSDIIFRPGSSTTANGARVCTNCGVGVSPSYANLVLPGNLCLYGPSGAVADCRSVWPSGGAGTSAWEYVIDTSPYGTPGVKYLQPDAANATRAIHIGSAAAPVSGIALNVDAFDGVLVRNANATGKAVATQGNAIFQDAHVKQSIRINGQRVFDSVNNGEWSGLDADTLDGNDVTLEPATSCSDNGGARRIACLCFQVKENTTMIKKCTALANRPF